LIAPRGDGRVTRRP